MTYAHGAMDAAGLRKAMVSHIPTMVFFCPKACPAPMLSPYLYPTALPMLNKTTATMSGAMSNNAKTVPESWVCRIVLSVSPITMDKLNAQR